MNTYLEQLSTQELNTIASRIFRNECGGKTDFLLHWNAGENFMSLGIGHFIWYPAGETNIFNEVFPELLAFMVTQGVTLPPFLEDFGVNGAPWPDRNTFIEQQNSSCAEQLRELLLSTMNFQIKFIIERTALTLKEKLSHRTAVVGKLAAVLSSPGGVYPIVDYINFKGDGVSEVERYNGFGWGLFQALEEMAEPGSCADFAEAARKVLRRRVENSPPERNEARWLPGWMNRIDTYTAT
ncbi:MAG: hypothetical protein WC071_07575 [Victivallaceae bacterium]